MEEKDYTVTKFTSLKEATEYADKKYKKGKEKILLALHQYLMLLILLFLKKKKMIKV